MRRFGASVLTLTALLTACGVDARERDVQASGDNTRRTFEASGFEHVSLAGPDNIVVRVGPAESVVAEGDSAVLDRIEVVVDGDTLKVRRKRDSGSVLMDGGRQGTARITVTLPRIAGASIAGSGDMDVDRADGTAFKGMIAGSGDLRIAAQTATAAGLDIAG